MLYNPKTYIHTKESDKFLKLLGGLVDTNMQILRWKITNYLIAESWEVKPVVVSVYNCPVLIFFPPYLLLATK